MSWESVSQKLTDWFTNGLGGSGGQILGIALMILGFLGGIYSYVVHRFNPQSRFPKWYSCVVMGVLGALASAGPEKVIQAFTIMKDTVLGLLGL